tara:strand:- start:1342 stop:1617 length:276 start_codon:yes stop_codon:yes gene_type:complete
MGQNIPMEEFDTGNDMTDNIQLRENKYFLDIFNTISETVITDEYYDKNEELFGVITEIFFDINERTGSMPPAMARRILEGIFSNILKHGLR